MVVLRRARSHAVLFGLRRHAVVRALVLAAAVLAVGGLTVLHDFVHLVEEARELLEHNRVLSHHRGHEASLDAEEHHHRHHHHHGDGETPAEHGEGALEHFGVALPTVPAPFVVPAPARTELSAALPLAGDLVPARFTLRPTSRGPPSV
jgi:hypothetical protein